VERKDIEECSQQIDSLSSDIGDSEDWTDVDGGEFALKFNSKISRGNY